MKIIKDKNHVFERKTVVTFGKFDGIHKGHQALIKKAREIADENNLEVVLFTFRLVDESKFGHAVSNYITTSEERCNICEKMGVDAVVEYPLDDITSEMEPMEFLDKIVKNFAKAEYVVVGTDWRFGKGRSGNTDILKAAQKLYNYTAVIVDKELYDGREISSTWVREEISHGKMENANILLGYAYSVYGKIIHGSEIGRKIGFPTINILPEIGKIIPPYGVYSSKIIFENKEYYGVTNIGVKPTVSDENKPVVETHIIDFAENAYGEYATVELCHFQRPEMKFENIEVLKNQLAQDTQFAKSFFIL